MLNVENILQSLIRLIKTVIMQLLVNLILLAIAHQLSLTSGLRVIDNGLGLPVYGSEERVVNYALLAADTKAALPSQLQTLLILFTFFSDHHLLVCNFGCFAHHPLLLSTTSSVWESLDLTVHE